MKTIKKTPKKRPKKTHFFDFSKQSVKYITLAFAIFFAAILIYGISSFASSPSAKPVAASPNPSKTFRVTPGSKQPVQFITYYTGSAKDGVMMQVAYHSQSDRSSAQWTTFGTNKRILGPNMVFMIANQEASTLSDANGLNCMMGYGSLTPPKNCTTEWKGKKTTGKAAFENTNIYFPPAPFSIGKYEWVTRTYDTHSKTYSKWTKPVSFTISDATKPVVQAKKTVTITTWGYGFHGNNPPAGQDFHLNLHDGQYAMDDEVWELPPTVTGLNQKVSTAMLNLSSAKTVMAMLDTEVLPRVNDGYKIDIEDSRGHHRAIVISRAFGKVLQANGYTVVYKDVDINRSWVQTPAALSQEKKWWSVWH